MNFVKGYKCTICHKEYPKDVSILTCPTCGEAGILDILYDYKEMKKVVTKHYFKSNQDYSIWRYRPLMSIDSSNPENTLRVGWTPLYKSNRLSNSLGIKDLYIKDEGMNPTQSLKDRASLVACIKAIEEGKTQIACSSTGNAASSLAGNAAKLGLKSIIFVPSRVPDGKLAQLVAYGAKVIKVEGDYKQTYNLSKEAIKEYGFYNRNAAVNPHLIEGKKTVAYEIAEQMNFADLDYIFVSVGDGCTIGSIYKGYYDLKQLGLITSIPKIVGVQSSGCSPFYDAWKNNRELQETDENTIADSIAVGIPRNPIKGMNAVVKSFGFFITVTDEEILKAIPLLGHHEGIYGEPAGVTGIAGIMKAVEENLVNKQAKIAVIITGNGLKDNRAIQKEIDKVILSNGQLDKIDFN